MLLACQSCHRQYEVGDLAPGRQMRCACGTLNRVPKRRIVQRDMACCGNCGAELEGEAKTCAHCEARVTIAEEGLGQACPECFVRLALSARFCHACGTGIKAEGVLQALTDTDCPRCGEGLSALEGVEHPHYQCTGCGGIWLTRQALEGFLDGAIARGAQAEERRQVAEAVRMRRKRKRSEPLAPCPVCRQLMRLFEFGRYSGVMVDHCERHGWWFDGGELETLEPFVRAGGLEEADKRRRARIRSRRVAAAWRRRCELESGRLLGRIPPRRLNRGRRTRVKKAPDFLAFLLGIVD